METISLAAPERGAPPATVHLLPCNIKLDGPARISTYFVPKVAEDGRLLAYFRGRELEGHRVVLPERVSGVVFREVAAPAGGAAAAGGAGPRDTGRGGETDEADAEHEDDPFADGDGFGGFDGGYDSLDEVHGSGRGGGAGSGEAKRGRTEGAEGAGSRASGAAAGGVGGSTGGGSGRRAWAADTHFREITDWHHDAPATDADLLPRALEWIEVARAMHE